MKHAPLVLGMALSSVVLAGSGGKPKPLDPTDPKVVEKDGVEMVSHQLLVKFESENAALERGKVFKKFQGREVERVGSTPLFLVQFPQDSNILDIKSKLEHIEGVSYAEPNLVMRTMPKGSAKDLK